MTYSIVANECIFVTCPHCGGDARKQSNMPSGFCEECINTGEVGEDVSDLMCLVHNLAIAGALCAAYILGYRSELDWIETATSWKPGCNRTAPEWK